MKNIDIKKTIKSIVSIVVHHPEDQSGLKVGDAECIRKEPLDIEYK